MELIHFADASSKGYGKVSYLRIIDDKGKIHGSFLYAKARLAPLKTVSIPRLELMAATLAAQIDGFLCSELAFFQQQRSTFWTDSMSVLLMLNNTNTRFPVFVANRLAKIEVSSPTQWRFVNSEFSAADHVSRGLSALDFVETTQWFAGQEFLNAPKETWPENPRTLPDLPDEFQPQPINCHGQSNVLCRSLRSLLIMGTS